ncbi:hypothetical protein MTO96_048036 [Rhipicephalus appendiculatus]
MAAAKTVLTAESIARVACRKWHVIVLGVVLAICILMEARRLSEERRVRRIISSRKASREITDAECDGEWKSKAYINCQPDQEPSPASCMQRGCCWLPDEVEGAPPCALFQLTQRATSQASSFKTIDSWTANLTLLKNASAPLPIPESATVTVTCIAFTHEFARLRIHDARQNEFETPVPPVPQDDGATYISYKFTAHRKYLAVGPNNFRGYKLRFLLSKMFHANGLKQLAVKLPGRIIYGLRGPRRVPFANASRWSKHTFFRSDGQVELTLSPNKVATFRVSGGVLDFFIFFGATPIEVVAQYTRLVGLPAMPSLGFIQNGTPAGTDREVVPFSMLVKEGLIENGANDSLRLAALRDTGGRCAAIVVTRLEQRLIDLTHPAAEHEWTKMFGALQAFEKLRIAGVMWLEAFKCLKGTSDAIECPENARKFPFDECGTAQLHLCQYSDVRNAYGYLMARMAHRVMAPKLGAYPALATSNDVFPGIGKWNVFWDLPYGAGARSLKRAVRDIQLYSILGLPYHLVSLCPVEAIFSNSRLVNCSLWLSLTVFLPVSEHVNISTGLDGALAADDTRPMNRYVTAVRDAQSLRSKFLPYLYTLIFKCSTTGDMIVRPLSFEFPGEQQAPSHSTQFMLGPHLMVVPKMEYQVSNGTALPTPVYVPRGVWYEWSTWRRVESRGSVFFVPSTNTFHPRLFARAGGIVVTRYESRGLNRERKTTAASDTTFLELTVCLDGTGSAEGELMTAPAEKEAPHAPWSEKISRFRFFYARNFLAGYCSPCLHGDVLGRVTILGLTKAPSRVDLNGEELAFRIDEQALMVESAYHVLTEPFVMKLN